MSEPTETPRPWKVIKVVKAVDEFVDRGMAEEDAEARNDAAKLLGTKARFVVVKHPG